MARGRKKPPEVEAAQGYPGKRKLKTEREINAITSDVITVEQDGSTVTAVQDVPPWLTENGKAIWREVIADLTRVRVIKTTDLNALARYCDYLALWQELRAQLTTKTGKLRTTFNMKTAAGGYYRAQDPRFGNMLKLDQRLKSLEDAFGLNPNARTALLTRLAQVSEHPPLAPGDAGERTNGPLGILNRKVSLN